MKKYLSILSTVAAALSLSAQQYFVGNCDKDALSYKCGEEMKFEISLMQDGKPVVGQKLKWEIRADDGSPERKGEAVSAAEPLRLATKCNTPGFVNVEVFAVNEKGEYLTTKSSAQHWGKKILRYAGGAGAEVEKIKNSGKEPADFDAFWQRQLEAQAKIPLKAEKKLLPKYSEGKFNVYELTVSCVGKPAKAFLSIPKNAKEKSLPMEVLFHGYGVDRTGPNMRDNTIFLTVERHSFELLREPEYYAKLKKGELKGFGLTAQDHKTPETCYFKFMILRDLRALEYAKKNVPQWNGKNIKVSGSSMGGFQSVFVAWLDKDVTRCTVFVPWMTDLWAADCGASRIPANFRPAYTPAIRYFDSTYAVKRLKCPLDITAWLGDYTCPPSGIMVLYNSSPTRTTLDFGQNGTHAGSVSKKETSKHYTLSK